MSESFDTFVELYLELAYLTASYAIYMMSLFVYLVFVAFNVFLMAIAVSRPFVWYQNHKR